MNDTTVRKFYNVCKTTLFPLVLIAFSLLKVNMGADITDTAYSLGNYSGFAEKSGVWFMLTFIPNAVGSLLRFLPFGETMLGMKIYTGIIVAAMSLLGYRFFMTKMPAWLSFLSQLAAIGMCWAPSVVLYHYLTYFFFLLASILLFRGLAGTKREYCLFAAGVLLGINTFVKFPGNGIEVLLIFALWAYGLMTQKDFSDVVRQTLLCVAGYIVSFLVCVVSLNIVYGKGALGVMIGGVFGIAGNASDYTFSQMILSILDAYVHGAKWAVYMVLCILPGIPFFVLWPGKYLKLRKIVYCVCIAFLFFVLGRWGMYNFRYYQKESALQWGAIFLLISIGIDIWMIGTRHLNNDWKLIGMISLVNILVIPLGSNNYIWPVLNDLFFIAPVTFWISYRFIRWGRAYLDETGKVPLFAVKAMLGGVVIAFFIQTMGVGIFYVFMDGEDGSPRNSFVTDNDVLRGMRTTKENAGQLSDISRFMSKNIDPDKKLIVFGDIPGMCYFMDRECAIETTWPDLASYPAEDFEEQLSAVKQETAGAAQKAPVIIRSQKQNDDPDGIEKKAQALEEFINESGYKEVFKNSGYTVYATDGVDIPE